MNRLRHLPLLALFAGPVLAQDRVAITSLEPPQLAIEIDAAKTASLIIRFDRDMDTRQHGVTGAGSSFPTVRHTYWLDARTFALDVTVQPEHVYSIPLVGVGSMHFTAADGTSLAPQTWRFATTGTKLGEGQAAIAATRLFAALRDQYSYRDRLGVDWQEIEHKHHDALIHAPDGPALALHVAEALAAAQDPHISVRWHDCTVPTFQRPVVANFDPRGLQKAFPKLQRVGRIGMRGRSDDGIGYLSISSFARELREDFDRAMQELRSLLDCKALVLDVRANGGGDEMLAKRLAAFFVQGDRIYAAHRMRDPKAPDGFRVREDHSIRGNNEPDTFPRAVAVLMGPQNMSTCEAFLLMMKQAPQAFLVGTDSYGSSGNPQQHTLVPNLTVALPSWQALRPDGTTFEGEGITPHIYVAATPEQLADDDPILAEALLRLRGQR